MRSKKHHAESGIAIVLNVRDGGIRAMATFPAYDPNHYAERTTRALLAEPGNRPAVRARLKTFKLVTTAAGLQSGAFSTSTTVPNPGAIERDGWTLRNWNGAGHGAITPGQMLSRADRLNATRWRGVRLQFAASWGEVYLASWPLFALAGLWIAVLAAIGVLVPDPRGAADGMTVPILALVVIGVLGSVLCIIRLEFNYKSLMVARGRIGGQAGRWKPVFSDFVRIWLATVGVFVASVAVVGVLGGVAVGGWAATFGAGRPRGLMFVLLMIAFFLGALLFFFLASAPARAYREARLFHLVWNNIGVSHVARFKCKLKTRSYVLLRVRNIVLTLLTLGFWRPFGLVSEYRMKAESVTLHVKGGLDQLAGQLAREEQGLGDAIADAVGLDLVG